MKHHFVDDGGGSRDGCDEVDDGEVVSFAFVISKRAAAAAADDCDDDDVVLW